MKKALEIITLFLLGMSAIGFVVSALKGDTLSSIEWLCIAIINQNNLQHNTK